MEVARLLKVAYVTMEYRCWPEHRQMYKNYVRPMNDMTKLGGLRWKKIALELEKKCWKIASLPRRPAMCLVGNDRRHIGEDAATIGRVDGSQGRRVLVEEIISGRGLEEGY